MTDPAGPVPTRPSAPASHSRRVRAAAAALACAIALPAVAAVPLAAAKTKADPNAAGLSGKALATLVAAAKKEGQLNVIALPPDWANYGQIISTFSKKYGIKVNSANPNGSSADELTAITSLKGQSRGPDVIDVAPQFAEQARQEGLLTPYKVATWKTVPAALRDPKGFWTGDYWGVIAFGVNTDVVKSVPSGWQALLGSDFRNKIALNGDPRKAGAAFGGVFAAALANGGSVKNIAPGISFFANLKKAGNFLPVDATPATVATGQTPVTVDWSYLQRGYADQLKGKVPWSVRVPSGPAFANYYAQAISKFAPHPNAAKLWEEFLYSDQGQNLWMKGYAYAARFADMKARNAVPKAILKNLPPADVVKRAVFPSLAQIEAAKNVVASQWGAQVAGS